MHFGPQFTSYLHPGLKLEKCSTVGIVKIRVVPKDAQFYVI